MAKNRIKFSEDFVLSNNKVGINTANPTSDLHVVGDGLISGILTSNSFSGDITSNISNLGIASASSIYVSGDSTFNSNVEINAGLKDIYDNVGAAGSILVSTGAGISWTPPYAAGVQGTQGTQGTTGTQGIQGITGPVAGSANQIVYKDASNNPTGSTSLTYTSPVSGVGTVGIGTVVDIVHYDTLNNGTLSWEGSAGQLFSISNNLTSGSIFSVNDVSGIPNIDVDADGTIQLAPYGSSEYVGIGTTNPQAKLDVNGDVLVSGVVTATDFNSTSDARLKANVQVIEGSLEKVLRINGVSFNWIENNKPSMGVIADELQNVLPELVSDSDPKTVNYNGLIGVLIEAVKELSARVEELESKT